jgi:argininosuccinate lyase
MSAPDRALARARLGAADPTAARFTGSLAFDQRLWPHDIVGSMAWARALARAGLLTDAERDRIVAGLETVRAELAGGTFAFRPELEDIHMNVERRLLELVGEVGGKLHEGGQLLAMHVPAGKFPK